MSDEAPPPAELKSGSAALCWTRTLQENTLSGHSVINALTSLNKKLKNEVT